MFQYDIGFFKYKKIIKDANNYIYNDIETGKMIKLDKECANMMKKRNSINYLFPQIDSSQIKHLSEKQIDINNTYLPSGVVYYNGFPVGVVYPYFFNNYNTFNDLYLEDSSLIIDNFKKSFFYNLELLNNNIYNTDLSFKNIMYKDNDVQLIDLDGRFIGDKDNSSYAQVYFYYLRDLRICVYDKLRAIYGEISNEVIEEVNPIFDNMFCNIEYDTPLKIIEEVEKKRVLK